MKNKIYILLVGILGIHLFLLTQLKFTAWPEMLLWPYLWIHNLLPYKDVAIAHTPLMLAELSLFFKIFGVGILQLKIFTWILILLLDGLVFFVSKKLWNTKTAIVAVAANVLWLTFFDGNGLWFDLYMGLLAFCSFYFAKQKRWVWVGIAWALAMISKQTAVWFLIPIGFELIQSAKQKVQKISHLVFGSVVIFLLFTVALSLSRILPSFYDWAINFGIITLPQAMGQIQLPALKNLSVALFPFLIFLPLFLKLKFKSTNLFLWAFAGMLGAYPRFEYFHFQPAIPFLAIATGIVIGSYKSGGRLIKSFLVSYLVISVFLFGGYFMRNYKEGVRFFEKDVSDVVTYVKANSNEGDKIFVMNWWENIYPLTDTLPATDPWVPQLSWYQELPSIQDEEVIDLANSKPKLILLQNYSDSGLSSYIPQKVYNYVMANYELKERVDGIDILIPIN
jgi:hypothetical protein